MTSNVGSQVIAEHAQQLRYVSGNDGLLLSLLFELIYYHCLVCHLIVQHIV